MTTSVSAKHLFRGTAVAAAMFVALGTVAALWDNPLFMRMTPAGGLLLIGSALLLEYFEPVRLYVALAGAALLAAAVWVKLTRPECLQAEAPATGASR